MTQQPAQQLVPLDRLADNQNPQNTFASGGGGTYTENHRERFFYALHNANYNVMALVTGGVLGGHLAERYEYTPYGERQVYSHGWMLADVDGDHVDDVDLLLTVLSGGAGSQPPDSRFGRQVQAASVRVSCCAAMRSRPASR